MRKIILIGIIGFVLDFVTKQWIVHYLMEDQSIMVIRNFFYLTYAKNTGVAFSMLEGNLVLIIIMTLVIMGMIFQYIKNSSCNKKELCCYGLVFGGALGNFVDRVFYGYVVDFLDFRIFGYYFPIFNLADCMIVIGVGLLCMISVFEESRGKNEDRSTSRRKS